MAHKELRGDVMLPIHWGTFNLAFHSWNEPAERVIAAAVGTNIVVPKPGQSIEPSSTPPLERWWK